MRVVFSIAASEVVFFSFYRISRQLCRQVGRKADASDLDLVIGDGFTAIAEL